MKYYTFLNHVTDSFSQKMYLDNNMDTLLNSNILSFSDENACFLRKYTVNIYIKVINKNKFTYHRVCCKL